VSGLKVNFTGKLKTVKYGELADEAFFNTARTYGDYVVWGGGRLRLTVKELMEVVLMG